MCARIVDLHTPKNLVYQDISTPVETIRSSVAQNVLLEPTGRIG